MTESVLSNSHEAQYLNGLGFTVEYLSGSQWASKSTAYFSEFRALVIGDTGDTPAVVFTSYLANAKAAWSPAVTGNVIIAGADPVGHSKWTLIDNALSYAVNDSAKTGLYITAGDNFPNNSAPVLDGLGAGWAGQNVNRNSVHVVTQHPVTSGLTDSWLSNWSDSVHYRFTVYPTDFHPLAIDVDSSSDWSGADGINRVIPDGWSCDNLQNTWDSVYNFGHEIWTSISQLFTEHDTKALSYFAVSLGEVLTGSNMGDCLLTPNDDHDNYNTYAYCIGTFIGGGLTNYITLGIGKAAIAKMKQIIKTVDETALLAKTPRAVSAFDDLAHSGSGIQSYRAQQAATRGLGGEIQAHHLIERRFANVMGGNTDDWASIVVTRAEHQQFTNAWRQEIPYGPTGTGMATRAQVEAAARQIYADYPEILRALGLG
ncbi:MAG: hypothetical protein KDB26_11160 [Microthrixaceae bacterium]|nr:hypothetical protein [Microthrixaceae bacterium]